MIRIETVQKAYIMGSISKFALLCAAMAFLAGCMPDFKAHLGNCKFYNCTHLHEPGCDVITATTKDPAEGGITPMRYRIYKELFAELSQPERY